MTDETGNSTPVAVELGDESRDTDGDGVPDYRDVCLASDLRASVNIGQCNSEVVNRLMGDGCSVADVVRPVAEQGGTNVNATLSTVQALAFDLEPEGGLNLEDVRALVSATLGNTLGSCRSYVE